MNKHFSIHVDVDSADTLLNFYRKNQDGYSIKKLEQFYSIGFNRATDFFEKENIKSTFFIVGQEPAQSDSIKEVLKNAYDEGHELANHTYTHRFGISELSENEIKNEITKCNKVLHSITKEDRFGFRSPGYNLNANTFNILEENCIYYDSSLAWPLLAPITKFYSLFEKINTRKTDYNYRLYNDIYYPDELKVYKKSSFKRNIVEIPLPHCLGMFPFYSTLHFRSGSLFRKLLTSTNAGYCIYLLHIIDFFSIEDKDVIPMELHNHLGIKIDVISKNKILSKVINKLKMNYSSILTRDKISSFLNNT
jgi:hypothetical protein